MYFSKFDRLRFYRLRDLCFDFWDDYRDYTTKVERNTKRGVLIRQCDQLLLDVSQRLYIMALMKHRYETVLAQRLIDACGSKVMQDTIFWHLEQNANPFTNCSEDDPHRDFAGASTNSDSDMDFHSPLSLSFIKDAFGINASERKDRAGCNCPLREWQRMLMSRPRLMHLKDSCLPSENFLNSLMKVPSDLVTPSIDAREFPSSSQDTSTTESQFRGKVNAFLESYSLPLRHREWCSYLELLSGNGEASHHVYWSMELLEGILKQVIFSRYQGSVVLVLGDGEYWKSHLKAQVRIRNEIIVKQHCSHRGKLVCRGVSHDCESAIDVERQALLPRDISNLSTRIVTLSDCLAGVSLSEAKQESSFLSSGSMDANLTDKRFRKTDTYRSGGIFNVGEFVSGNKTADQIDAAIRYAQPDLILCSSMPAAQDFTQIFRRHACVQEYILVGPKDTDTCGRLWETWGKPDLFADSKNYRDIHSPHKQDGFVRKENRELSRYAIGSDDRPGRIGFYHAVHFLRHWVVPAT